MKTLNIILLAQFARAIQPTAPPAKPEQLRDLTWGRLNFLQTTDTHGWHAGHLQEPQYSADWGDYVSFVDRMKRLADQKGVDLLVVDTGDRIEGSGLSDASIPKGHYVREIFKTVHMDVVTTGNHELYKKESSENEYLHMVPDYNGNYVVSNVDIYDPDTQELVPMGNRSITFTTPNQGIRIKAFGFLFDFLRNWNNTVVHQVEKVVETEWFQNEIQEEVDLFLIIGHTPVRESPEFPSILRAIRAVHPNVPVQFFGGHTHIRDYTIYDQLSTGLESGRYCESVGFLSISHLPSPKEPQPPTYSRRYIDFNRFGFQHHSESHPSEFDTEIGLSLSKSITKIRTDLGLDKVYGCAPQDYFMFRVPYPHPSSLYTLLEEEVLPKMVRNEERKDVPRLIYINSGSQRFDIFKGPFTYDTSFIVSPFTSVFNVIKDVDYEVAKKLIVLFNQDKGSWMVGSLEPHYHFKQMAALAEASNMQSEKLGQQQIPLGDHTNVWTIPFEDEDEADSHTTLTPGYTTTDDAGTNGDDTPHKRLKYFRTPNAIAANASFPIDGTDPATVDVVFMDFIEPYILAALFVLGREYKHEDVDAFMGKDDTLTALMLRFVEEEWGGNC